MMTTEERMEATQTQRARVRRDEGEASTQYVKEKIFSVDALGQRKIHTPVLEDTTTTPSDVSSVRANQQPVCEDEYVSGEPLPSKARTLHQLLHHTTVENLLANEGGDIISLREEDTVEDALNAFRSSEIQCAPVYTRDGTYVRIVDVRDIFCAFFCTQSDDLTSFFKQPIKNVTDSMSANTPQLPMGTSLAVATKTLAAGGVHHICIPDKFSKAMFNIITELSLLEFIAKNISLLGEDLRSLPVSKIMISPVSVQTIPSDTSTREAFEYLFRDNFRACAVVDKEGRLIDTISVSDLVGVVHDHFEYLQAPVIEFLQATRRTTAVKPPITCTLKDTLAHVTATLASTHVHTLWVVDDDVHTHAQQYLGFVSVTNVLQAVCSGGLDD